MALLPDLLETFLGSPNLPGKKFSYPEDTIKRLHVGAQVNRHSLWTSPGKAPDMWFSSQLRPQTLGSKDNALSEFLTLRKYKINKMVVVLSH